MGPSGGPRAGLHPVRKCSPQTCQCIFCRGLDGQCACELNHYRLAHNEGCRALNIRDPMALLYYEWLVAQREGCSGVYESTIRQP